MPNFAKAEISTAVEDLTVYKTFLKRLVVGQVVMLPLEEGETTRRVMRALNSAARESGVRLSRLASESSMVRFKVMPSEKRPVVLTPEARQARTDKARATKASRRQAAG